MARIPRGNFGFDVAAPQPRTEAPAAAFGGAGEIARAFGEAGQAVQAAGQREAIDLREQALESQQESRRAIQQVTELARAQAANSLLDEELAVKTLADDVRDRLARGELNHRAAREAFDSALSLRDVPTIADLDPVGQLNLQRGVRRVREQAALGLDQAIEKAQRFEIRSQGVQALDTLGKLAAAPGADIERINAQADQFAPVLRAGGLDEAQVAKTVQDFKDRNWTNHATQRAMQSAQSMEELDALARDLTSGYYVGKLDTDKRNGILRGVLADQEQLRRRQELMANRVEARAERAINEIDRQIASGVPATPAMWAAWADTVKGSTMEAAYRERIEGEREVQGVLRMPIAQQIAFVQTREAQLMQTGGTARDAANLTRIKAAVDANVKLMQEAPLLFAERRNGVTIPPLDLQTLASAPDKIAPALRERAATVTALQRESPGVRMHLLMPQEARALSSIFDASGPRDQAQMLSMLRVAAGDDQAFRSIMQQVTPDSPVRSFAGLIMTKQRPGVTSEGWISNDTVPAGDVAVTLLTGENLLNKSKAARAADGKPTGFPLPPEKEFRDAFSSVVERAFAGRPDAFELAQQVVRAYYVGKSAQEGDVSGTVDTRRMSDAIRATLGQPVDINGSTVLAPWGMTASEFKDKAAAAFSAEAKRRGLDARFSFYTLRNLGDGTYLATNGLDTLVDRDGRPVVIDLTRPGDNPTDRARLERLSREQPVPR